MQKSAPSAGRLILAGGFTLSCFALILFLWVSFGGPTPLSSKSYRITAFFPEATALALEADVRVGGVNIGKVKEIEPAPIEKRVNGKDTTAAVMEIEPRFAPISSDAEAILRQKTLLGETFVELTGGTETGERTMPVALGAAANPTPSSLAAAGEPIPEDGELPIGQVTEATQVDELFNALGGKTRTITRELIGSGAIALDGRGGDLNDALGNLSPLIEDATEITELVERQRPAVQGLIRDTGNVFAAVRREQGVLRGSITGAADTFGGLADAQDELAETVAILPTFERESLATLQRLDRLRENAEPVVAALLPVADDISPTLRSARQLAPPLRRVLVELGPLLDAAEEGLPAASSVTRELRPLLRELDPLLANAAPIVRFLTAYKETVATFFVNPSIGISSTLPKRPGQPGPRHYLRTLAYTSPETLSIYPTRLPTNRGSAYIPPGGYLRSALQGSLPSFDCKNTDYTQVSQDADEDEVFLESDPPPDVNGGEHFDED
ncbi:MAG: MlaD family protein, partial [Solirubrobacterales bacterium]